MIKVTPKTETVTTGYTIDLSGDDIGYFQWMLRDFQRLRNAEFTGDQAPPWPWLNALLKSLHMDGD